MPRVRIDYPEESVFATEIPVRVSDLNYANHLGHDSLVSMLHQARATMLRAFGLSELDTDGHALRIVDLAVSYRAEAGFGDVLRIDIAADEVGSRSCALLYRVTLRDSGTEVALARTGVVFVDAARGVVVKLPQSFVATVVGSRQ